MKDNTFKWMSKFFIILGIIYWLCLILAATGCQTYEYDVKNKFHKKPDYEDIDKRLLELWLESDKYKNPNETTINLDPMDRTQWHEREQFLQHFDY
jgi:hypothetical protein